MKTAREILVAAVLIFTLIGCHAEGFRHDPLMAVSNANEFLRVLYFKQDYDRTLEIADSQLRQSLTVEELREMVHGIEKERGALLTLKTESYLMVQGRGMELFYVGLYERGSLYHRLVLMGDASSGYRVSGVWSCKYPENSDH